jgi:cardiolipin synthase
MSDAGAGQGREDDGQIVCTIEGNRLRVIAEGPDLLEALVALIDGAQRSLKLFYYIFESDRSGRRVLARLIRALRRGVTVTLMIDAFGSSGAEEGFFNSFIGAGGRFGLFGARRSTRYLIRNHQKIALADDSALMIGGFNIGDAYFGLPEEDCWHDLGLLIEGPQVTPMVRWYGQMWHWVSSRKQRFGTLRAMVRQWRRRGEGRGGGRQKHVSLADRRPDAVAQPLGASGEARSGTCAAPAHDRGLFLARTGDAEADRRHRRTR